MGRAHCAAYADHPGGTDYTDYVERALLAARDLIESTVSRHRRELAKASLAAAVPADAIERLVCGATQSVSAVLTGVEQEGPLLAGLARLPAAGGEPIAVRLLCVPSAVHTTRIRAVARNTSRFEVRVADSELQEALLVDGRTAYVRHGQEQDGRRQASIVEDPATVHAMELMFAGAWGNAVELAEYPRLNGRLCAQSVRRILESMRTGNTDEVAAREMQVSLRTYRRHVAEVMRELGANSRFQAGVRAVELGLLPGRH
ncbi:response regulator transcription factor [Streptomyces palmae]|uniref:Response regulator transcription factor n=1 Tax=Streptomyces palmae TaxID=1701085 RepID=A0A4Z0GB55_9ACTN|nr:response regulator transcription factor [Streptomyces palmae]